jgi:hypothetical protein
MGNTSSVPSSLETQGHPRKSNQKLSKPRTGNPASAGLLPNGFSASTSRFSGARVSNQALPLSPVVSSHPVIATSAALVPDDDGNTEESAENKIAETSTPVQPKESKRRSLFRTLSSQKTKTQSDRRNSTVDPSPQAPAPPVADKVIRANSMTYESTQAHIAYYAQPPIPVPEK